MVMDAETNLPIGTVISQVIEAIIEVVVASENVPIEKKSFAQLSSYLHKIVPLLSELSGKDSCDSDSLRNFVEILNHQTKLAKQLILDCIDRNRYFLECWGRLVNEMKNVEFKAAIAEEEVLEKIEFGIHQRNVDRTFANNLLVSIAKAVGVSIDHTALKREFEEFKSEIENLRLRKNEAVQMDQIIALLERTDNIASSFEVREKRYLVKRKSLGMQPLEPLMTFYCL